jgi:hypothetical protein
MLRDTSAKRNGREHYGKREADLVNDRSAKEPTSRRYQRKQHRRGQAVNQAKPGQRHRNPVESAGPN